MDAIPRRFIALLAAIGLLALSGTAVVAQQNADDQPYGAPAADDTDPPTEAARLSYVQGAVSVQPAGVDDWTAAVVNRPLTSGDQLWSDRGSRAEIELDTATVSLAASSTLLLLDLSAAEVQLQVSAGTASITLRDLDPSGSFEVDAPNASVSLVRPGTYRIGVDDAGNTTVAMRDGQAQVTTSSGQSVILRGGQAAQFGPSGAVDVAALGPPDEFDRWCAQRAQRWAQNQNASRYVASNVVGAQELDEYGEWRQEPDYGYVWYPTAVAVDWAPYRYGRWLWVTPWGWTWVDNAPWGYAPFHYGRWAFLRQRWCWVPAPPRSRAVYAPALVAWIGGGGGPGVGWLPLAPGEVYLPGYRVSPRYLQNVNVSNTTIINNTYITDVSQNPALQNRYANRSAPRALTVVSQSTFASGQSVAGRIIEPPPQWQRERVTPRPPAIMPARESVLGASAQTPVRRPPIAIEHRPVIARHEPPPPPPAFDRQLDAIRANGGRALPPAQLQRLPAPDNRRPNIVLAPPAPRYVPAVPTAPGAPASPPPNFSPGDRRFVPERSPTMQSRSSVQSRPTVQSPPPLPAIALPQRQPQPPPPPPPPPAIRLPQPPPVQPQPQPQQEPQPQLQQRSQPQPQQEPQPKGRGNPQVLRPEMRRGDPN